MMTIILLCIIGLAAAGLSENLRLQRELRRRRRICDDAAKLKVWYEQSVASGHAVNQLSCQTITRLRWLCESVAEYGGDTDVTIVDEAAIARMESRRPE